MNMPPEQALDLKHPGRSGAAQEHQTKGGDHESSGSKPTAAPSTVVSRKQSEAACGEGGVEASETSKLSEPETTQDNDSPSQTYLPPNFPSADPLNIMERLVEAMGEYLYKLISICIEVPIACTGSLVEQNLTRIKNKTLRLQQIIKLHESDHYKHILNQMVSGEESLLYYERRMLEYSFWDSMDIVCYRKSLTKAEKALSKVLLQFIFRAGLIIGWGRNKDEEKAKAARVYFMELEKIPAIVSKWYCIRWYLYDFYCWWSRRQSERTWQVEDYNHELRVWNPHNGPLDNDSFWKFAMLVEDERADVWRIIRKQVKKRAMKPHGDRPYRELYSEPDIFDKPETGPLWVDALDAEFLAAAFGINDLLDVYPPVFLDVFEPQQNFGASLNDEPIQPIASSTQNGREGEDHGEPQEMQRGSIKQDLNQPLTTHLEVLTLNSNGDKKNEEQ